MNAKYRRMVEETRLFDGSMPRAKETIVEYFSDDNLNRMFENKGKPWFENEEERQAVIETAIEMWENMLASEAEASLEEQQERALQRAWDRYEEDGHF